MSPRVFKPAFAGVAFAFSFTALAASQTITVTTLFDRTDFASPQTIAQLPGPDGQISLQEACRAANNTSGPQTIEFAIPTNEFWLFTDVGLIELEQGLFALTDDQTTIDFSSQTRNVGDTNPNGPELGIYGLEPNGWGSPAIIIHASECVIRGLGTVLQRGSAVAIWAGHSNRVVGCDTSTILIDGSFGGPVTHSNIVGGTTPDDSNVLLTVEITCWSNDNVVVGNRIQHVRVEGSRYCVFPARNRIGGPTPAERNVIAGWGRFGEEGFPVGVMVDVVWAEDTIVEGNYIGTTPDGLAREPQIAPGGVQVRDSINTTVRGNLIAGLKTEGRNHYQGQLFGEAITVGAVNRDNETTIIENNVIGLGADGETIIPTLNGIVAAPFTARQHVFDTRIGGTEPGQGNEIAFVERYGLFVASLENGVTISGNSIHDSGLLGIELIPNSGADGPTPNDALDADSGGNRLQNFPVLTQATTDGSSTHVVGALSSAPSRSYRVEFFASPACDPSGFGEGEVFLGFVEVTTDASGEAAFDATLSLAASAGWVATATATDLTTGDTSEFSACLEISQGSHVAGDVDGDGDVDLSDLATALAHFGLTQGAARGDGDLDGDGDVDLSDLATLLANFGA